MTSRRGDDNGPSSQPEGSPRPVSGLPPEWGEVIIPDDVTELDREASKIRRELRRTARGAHWNLKSLFRAPVIIVALAVLLALTSLFSILGPMDRSQTARFPAEPPTPLPDITLLDEHNNSIRIGDHLPAAILLLDGCSCSELATAVAANVPAGVSVILVSEQAPVDSGPGLRLADPSGKVRSSTGAGIAVPAEAAVLLVDSRGDIVRLLPGTNSIDDFSTDLESLAK
ncbi:MAG: hypothetical protein H0T78_11830 [Longispora sp.]|nr:hypothetical protein [Longispora sp. (in: high G+C Gram-positive bacteria)]